MQVNNKYSKEDSKNVSNITDNKGIKQDSNIEIQEASRIANFQADNKGSQEAGNKGILVTSNEGFPGNK